ncbi:MAG: hypothetical protein CMH32_00880 [Micavibrio sp.]|nr:hypothetical protein [Micavibrio sp.]HCK32547.1 hypothetical protein [Rhodospirillaceae bacterium]|tara:strand:- start:309 stop:728 length:420 start_codon:yes stop_codon:yes gene_type:complete
MPNSDLIEDVVVTDGDREKPEQKKISAWHKLSDSIQGTFFGAATGAGFGLAFGMQKLLEEFDFTWNEIHFDTLAQVTGAIIGLAATLKLREKYFDPEDSDTATLLPAGIAAGIAIVLIRNPDLIVKAANTATNIALNIA